MVASYRQIDYRLRPAKHAERLMMCEAFRRLRFASVESYQYVGLGSVYFSDFSLFHRALGINKMISIEKAIHDKDRFMQNLPYANIEMKWGATAVVTPEIDWSIRSIVWFDYDGLLSKDILDDVRTVATKACVGTAFIVSVQCNPESSENPEKKVVDVLVDRLGRERVDPALVDDDLMGWGMARTVRQILANEIEKTLADRNGVRPDPQKIEFRQIFNFHYQDGARMLTFGGIFYDRGQQAIFDQCAFSDLPFVRSGPESFLIDTPKLTTREIKRLEMQMPLNGAALDRGAMPPRDADSYVSIYRYFHHFTPIDL